MSELADTVLPLIRTRADVYRWNKADEHGQQMREAVDILEAALPTSDPLEAYSLTGGMPDGANGRHC